MPKSASRVIQLVRQDKTGGLGSDNMKIDWRKRYKKRERTISEIQEYAMTIFNEKNYDWLTHNCQGFAQMLIKFAGND